MQLRNIHKHTQVKVMKYLEFVNKSEQNEILLGTDVLNSLSSVLQEEIYQEYYGKILDKCQFLKDHFSSSLIRQLSLLMKEKMLGPSEMLFCRNDFDTNLYFLQKGEI